MIPLELIQGVATGGFATLAIVGLWAFFTGKTRVGTLVDAAALKREAEFAARELERDKREAVLLTELAEWKARSLANDARTDKMGERLELAYGILTGAVKTPGPGSSGGAT